MTPEDRSTISAMVTETARDLFAARGGLEELAADAPMDGDKGCVAATVGLSGAELRGALVMVAHPSFFRITYPPELGVPTEPDLADWAREAVNQLLGRLKNRFARYGVNFNIATPTVLAGDHLRLRPDPPTPIKQCLRLGTERMDVYFHIVRDDGKSLLAHGGPPVAASAEGDALLF